MFRWGGGAPKFALMRFGDQSDDAAARFSPPAAQPAAVAPRRCDAPAADSGRCPVRRWQLTGPRRPTLPSRPPHWLLPSSLRHPSTIGHASALSSCDTPHTHPPLASARVMGAPARRRATPTCPAHTARPAGTAVPRRARPPPGACQVASCECRLGPTGGAPTGGASKTRSPYGPEGQPNVPGMTARAAPSYSAYFAVGRPHQRRNGRQPPLSLTVSSAQRGSPPRRTRPHRFLAQRRQARDNTQAAASAGSRPCGSSHRLGPPATASSIPAWSLGRQPLSWGCPRCHPLLPLQFSQSLPPI